MAQYEKTLTQDSPFDNQNQLLLWGLSGKSVLLLPANKKLHKGDQKLF